MQLERISIRDFTQQLGYTRGTDNALAACYYAEFVEKRPDFGVADIEDLLYAAKVPESKNLSRDLKSLHEKKLLNLAKTAAPGAFRYTLTNQGADQINERMRQVGLVITKPTERAEILKEVSESLNTLVKTIPIAAERDYIEEAISCLSPLNNALRAAVVMGWTGTLHCLRRKVDEKGAAGYAQFSHHLYAAIKAKPVGNLNDLEDVKDDHLLDICEKMNILAGKSVKDQLVQWLKFRHGCGHPTNVKPGIHKVKAFFEDVIQYVLAVT